MYASGVGTFVFYSIFRISLMRKRLCWDFYKNVSASFCKVTCVRLRACIFLFISFRDVFEKALGGPSFVWISFFFKIAFFFQDCSTELYKNVTTLKVNT